MSTYAIIDTGGEQLRVEPGRFYDVRYSASLKPKILAPNTKILIYRILLICNESTINLGHPWLENAIVRGRILHPSFGDRITIYKMHSKKKTRRKLGYRQDLVRFVVDSICLNGEEL
uniref:Large ribosomal subunit protein bL21m n=3 Tax=Angiopteris TaxID=3266 RepID=A0A0B5ELC5_9MONI|nr:ribosomal protein L21 [Angiopteris evecta]YP_009117822.1 ribosomal protein L21 [Angiopteris angustifolia]YP_009992477.1 ribosomal protein L21 [Angiopteris yunnanensis]ABG79647.1 ribosomal protein L21 [Angiopteris evecta]AJE71365.1 ribosomal protein L21 [Angiopteris angustifolia]QNN90662.1 ribosomal protein L21 [Angiopteris yunnanensis]